MHINGTSKALLAAMLAIVSTAVVAQNPAQGQPSGQGQGQPQGQGQQPPAQQRQMERATDQNRTAEQARLQQRERDRTQQPADKGQNDKVEAATGGIYGGNLMTEQERKQYRERLDALEGEQERNAFMNQHREEMQQRSRQRGIPIEVTGD